MNDSAVAATLLTLEQRLMQPELRASRGAAGALLADDFFEIGRSGRTFDKAQILDALVDEPLPEVPIITEFVARALAPDLTLVTYRTDRARRSSIWRHANGQWQIIFHQGSALPDSGPDDG